MSVKKLYKNERKITGRHNILEETKEKSKEGKTLQRGRNKKPFECEFGKEEGKEKQVDEAKEMLLRVIDERLPKIQQFVKEFPKYQVEIDTLISLKKHIVSFSK